MISNVPLFEKVYVKWLSTDGLPETQRSVVRRKCLAELWDTPWTKGWDSVMTEEQKFVMLRCLGYEGRWGDSSAAAEYLMSYIDKFRN